MIYINADVYAHTSTPTDTNRNSISAHLQPNTSILTLTPTFTIVQPATRASTHPQTHTHTRARHTHTHKQARIHKYLSNSERYTYIIPSLFTFTTDYITGEVSERLIKSIYRRSKHRISIIRIAYKRGVDPWN